MKLARSLRAATPSALSEPDDHELRLLSDLIQAHAGIQLRGAKRALLHARLAVSSARVEMSVARTSTVQPALFGKCVSRSMASEKGSSPVEHAALHTRRCLERLFIAASVDHSRNRCSVRYSSWMGSRKKCVSPVAIRSIIRASSRPVFSCEMRSKYAP